MFHHKRPELWHKIILFVRLKTALTHVLNHTNKFNFHNAPLMPRAQVSYTGLNRFSLTGNNTYIRQLKTM